MVDAFNCLISEVIMVSYHGLHSQNASHDFPLQPLQPWLSFGKGKYQHLISFTNHMERIKVNSVRMKKILQITQILALDK